MTSSDPKDLAARLAAAATAVEFPPGGKTLVLDDAVISRLAAESAGRSPAPPAEKRAVEVAALAAGICPRRYLRNIGTLGLEGQARLLQARVGQAGLGGLGGTLAEILARAGVGELVLVDPDVFSQDNLNRQFLATEDDVGRSKTEAAVRRLGRVNSATTVTVHAVSGDGESFSRLFAGVDVVVDALDSLPSRFDLEDAARRLGVPMVHGAIAGLSGQVTTFFPGDPGLEALYGPRRTAAARGVEALVGNPSATPAMIAALEAQEVLKIVTGVGKPLRRKLLILDALSPYAAVVEL